MMLSGASGHHSALHALFWFVPQEARSSTTAMAPTRGHMRRCSRLR